MSPSTPFAGLDARVLRVLPNYRAAVWPTAGSVAALSGLSLDECRNVLSRLRDAGVVERSSSGWPIRWSRARVIA